MGGPSGGQSSSSQQSSSTPWSAQQPYLKNIYQRAEGLYNQGPREFYPGQTYAGRDPGAQAALDKTSSMGLAGNPLDARARNQAEQTISGQYLNPDTNPYLKQTYQRASEALGEEFNQNVGGGVGGRFGGAGRTGSPGELRARDLTERNYGRRLEDLAGNIYGGNYQAERGRQQSATQNAPQLSQARYAELGQAAGAGMENERFGQQSIDELMARFAHTQNQPYDELAQYSSYIGQPVNTSQSSGKSSAWNAKAWG